MSDKALCDVCGEPMPVGEEMFNYHGFSGPCPKPPLPPKPTPLEIANETIARLTRELSEATQDRGQLIRSLTASGDDCAKLEQELSEARQEKTELEAIQNGLRDQLSEARAEVERLLGVIDDMIAAPNLPAYVRRILRAALKTAKPDDEPQTTRRQSRDLRGAHAEG